MTAHNSKPRRFTLYHPSTNFLSFSVTGSSCARNCAHCGGHYLKGMIPVSSPEELYLRCRAFHDGGGRGALVSGGCDPEGKIDFSPFLTTLDRIARLPGFRLNVHTGFLDRDGAEELAQIPFGSVSMDVVGSGETLCEVYGLDASPGSYDEVFGIFTGHGLTVTPHICIGLHYGRLKGEFRAVDLVVRHGGSVEKLIFIILVPTKGSEMEHIAPPSREEVLNVVSYARKHFSGELVLGCMRPRDPELELDLIRAGMDGVAAPLNSVRKAVLELAGDGQLMVVEEEGCCSF